MLETGLESISYNLNRRNNHLQLFEFGKTYYSEAVGQYLEKEHLCLYSSGRITEDSWREKSKEHDFFRLKGLAIALFELCGLANIRFQQTAEDGVEIAVFNGNQLIGKLTEVAKKKLNSFDIKQPVFVLDILFEQLLGEVEKTKIQHKNRLLNIKTV